MDRSLKMETGAEGEFVRWEDEDTDAKRGRKESPAARRAARLAHAQALGTDASEVRAGVSLTWLATATKMDLRTVKNRLGRLKSLGPHGPRGSMVYDFNDAMTLLARPPPDQFANYMRSLRVQDMPTHLQESYWGALRKKQLWEMHAGELWKTTDVLDVFGDVFQVLKNTIQLWADNLDTKGDMSQEQRDALTEMMDGLLQDIHGRLVQMPQVSRRGSSADDPDANPDSEREEDLIG
jgi:hypothetical protein